MKEADRPLITPSFLMLGVADASQLRQLHEAGDDTAVLSRARELAGRTDDQLVVGPAWEPIDGCLRGHYALDTGEAVFGRRDWDIRLADPAVVTATAATLPQVGRAWLRERYTATVLSQPGPVPPGDPADFEPVWLSFALLTAFFARAAAAGRPVLFSAPSRRWRPPRRVTGPDGVTRVVRPRYRPGDYTVEPSAVRTLPADGGSWPFDAELDERDGVLYTWTEVERFTRNGRTWVRMTPAKSAEFYIDVENAGDRIGRIEWVDPLIAYGLARRADHCPVILED